jgi:hypothetical protein
MTRVTVAHAFLNRWRWYLCGAGAACTVLWSHYFLSTMQHRPRVLPRPHGFGFDSDNTNKPTNSQTPETIPSGPDAAANSTLWYVAPSTPCDKTVMLCLRVTDSVQFEAILALSPFPSWRTTGLLAAAHYTGLDIRIPPQPPINPEMIDAFCGARPRGSTPPEPRFRTRLGRAPRSDQTRRAS